MLRAHCMLCTGMTASGMCCHPSADPSATPDACCSPKGEGFVNDTDAYQSEGVGIESREATVNARAIKSTSGFVATVPYVLP